MRSLLIFCGCLLLSTALSAQYERGNWYLSADSQSEGLGTRLGAGARTGVGYFVKDRFLVGTRVETGENFSGFTGGDSWVNPFARYYFPSKKTNLSFFAEAGAGLGFGRRGGLSATAAVGAEYQLAPGAMLTASLEYATKDEDFDHRLGLNLGLSVILGEAYKPDGEYDFLHRRGTLMLNGNIGNLSLGTANGQTSLLGSVNLEAGYFLSERLVIEGKFQYTADYFDLVIFEIPRNFRTRNVEATVGGNYFFLTGRRFQPYVGAGLSYESQHWRETTLGAANLEWRSDNFSAYLKTGFLYHLNERVAVDLNVGYRSSFSGGDYGLFIGGIGLKVFLGKK